MIGSKEVVLEGKADLHEAQLPAAEPSTSSVRVLRTLAELEELRQEWTGWCDDPNADLDLYLAWARRRPEFVRPHVIVIYRGARPDCILVGRLELARVELKIGYFVLFRPKVARLFFVRDGLLGNVCDENIKLLVKELRKCLRRREATLAEIPKVRPLPALDEAVGKEFGTFSRGHFLPLQEHRWLELPDNYEDFLQALSRKNRHEIRRHQKRLNEEFGKRARIQCYHEAAEVDNLVRDVESISEKSYQRALGVGFRADEETMESLRIIANQGGLRGCVLYLDDQPSAFFVGRQYKHKLHGTYMGFDPQFSKYSPGVIILMHGIQDCFDPANRATHMDLGWGDRQYKRMICNRTRQDGFLHVYAPTWKGLRLNLLRSTTSLIDTLARRALERSHWLQVIRKKWLARLQESQIADGSAAPSPMEGES